MARRLKIPYGIKDFKRIRNEGYYYVDKTAYIRKMEERDRFVFFVRPRRMGKSLFVETLRCYYDASHSYLIELKYAAKDASDEEMAEKVAEAKAQLAKYRADRSVPSLARG